MPAEAPQLSCFNGKEPFGPLRSFSALLKVPAGRRSCASGSSAAFMFQWQRALWSPKILLCAAHSARWPLFRALTFRCQRAPWSPKILLCAAQSARWPPFMCQRKLRSSHFLMTKSPLVPCNILLCAAQSAPWSPFICQRKLRALTFQWQRAL